MQQEKLRKQRALTRTKGSSPTSQRVEKVKVKVEPQKQLKGKPTPKALPPSKKGGAIKTTRGPRRTNVNKPPTTKPQVGKPGKGGVKPQLRLPPKGGTASTLLKNAKAGASLGSRGLGGVGLVLSGISTAQDLTASLKRGEGYASLPKLAKAIAKGKPKKTTGGTSNRRGRSASKPSPKPTKRGMSNIPAKEGTGKGSPNDKPKVTAKKPPKAAPKASAPKASAPKASAPKASAPKKKTGANDSRNADYIAARSKLTKTSTKAERDKVRDMGLKISKGIHGDKNKKKK